jgi:hypothetical protein
VKIGISTLWVMVFRAAPWRTGVGFVSGAILGILHRLG